MLRRSSRWWRSQQSHGRVESLSTANSWEQSLIGWHFEASEVDVWLQGRQPGWSEEPCVQGTMSLEMIDSLSLFLSHCTVLPFLYHWSRFLRLIESSTLSCLGTVTEAFISWDALLCTAFLSFVEGQFLLREAHWIVKCRPLARHTQSVPELFIWSMERVVLRTRCFVVILHYTWRRTVHDAPLTFGCFSSHLQPSSC